MLSQTLAEVVGEYVLPPNLPQLGEEPAAPRRSFMTASHIHFPTAHHSMQKNYHHDETNHPLASPEKQKPPSPPANGPHPNPTPS
jgi:hypothetical protein